MPCSLYIFYIFTQKIKLTLFFYFPNLIINKKNASMYENKIFLCSYKQILDSIDPIFGELPLQMSRATRFIQSSVIMPYNKYNKCARVDNKRFHMTNNVRVLYIG